MFARFLLIVIISSTLISCGIESELTDSEGSHNTQSELILTKTGVQTSYTDYDDGYYQSGAEPNFFRDDTLGVVTDNLHKLMWQDNDAVGSITYTWTDAVAYCESLELAGYSDWRLPEMDELESIIDYGERDIISVFQHKNPSWSSNATSDNNAWVFRITTDNAMFQFLELDSIGDTIEHTSSTQNIRCVRGKQYRQYLNSDENDNIIYDLKTGLAWENNHESHKLSFLDAVSYCSELRIGGYADWRVPNIRELRSIYDYSNMGIISIFYNDNSSTFWTSTLRSTSNVGASYMTLILKGFEIKDSTVMPFAIIGSDYDLDGNYDVFQFVMNTSGSAEQYGSAVFYSAFLTLTLDELNALNSLSREYPSVKCVR